MSGKLRILHAVEYYDPSVGGAQEVVRQLSQRLAARGHDVTVATTALPERKSSVINGVKVAEFRASGSLARGLQGDIEGYRRFVLEQDFDIILNYAAQQWTSDALFGILGQIKAKKVFVPCGFSGLFDALFEDYFKSMPAWMGAYDACVYLSDNYRDINFARTHGLQNGQLIPNGAGEDEFSIAPDPDIRQKLGLKPGELFLLTVGSHTGMKGHDEAAQMLRKSGVEGAALVVLGNSFGGGCTRGCAWRAAWSRLSPLWRKRRIRVLNAQVPRADVVAAYQAADLFLFPSNIEASPLVLFEACAAALPFLSGPAGNSAEIAGWTGGGLILPAVQDEKGYTRCHIEEGSRMLRELCENPDERLKLGRAGQWAWRNRFTWERICSDYESLYFRLLAHAK